MESIANGKRQMAMRFVICSRCHKTTPSSTQHKITRLLFSANKTTVVVQWAQATHKHTRRQKHKVPTLNNKLKTRQQLQQTCSDCVRVFGSANLPATTCGTKTAPVTAAAIAMHTRGTKRYICRF